MEMYEVDLRSKKTGSSVETIFSTESHDEAWDMAKKYNDEHGYILDDLPNGYESLIDGKSDGLFADVYQIEHKEQLHSIGK